MNLKLTYSVSSSKEVSVELPFSKSIVNRLAVIYSLGEFSETVRDYSSCEDTDVILNALSDEGEICNAGASGTALRFLISYFALKGKKRIITGTERLCERPVGDLVDALRKLGAVISYKSSDGCPPVIISGGKLDGGVLYFPGSNISSQYVSSLMLIAPYLKGGLEIHLSPSAVSYSYILMTAGVMSSFGASVDIENNIIKIREGVYKYNPDFCITRDWSAASYWYELVSVLPHLTVRLKDMAKSSDGEICLQGDSRLISIYRHFGVETVADGDDLLIYRREKQNSGPLELDLSDNPDIVPALCVSCLMNNCFFYFSGVSHLRYKESDRIAALIKETAKLGYKLHWDDTKSVFYWDGKKSVKDKNIIFETYNDHRLSMAFSAVSAIWNNITINDAGNVIKSYKTFWQDLGKTGITVNETRQI